MRMKQWGMTGTLVVVAENKGAAEAEMQRQAAQQATGRASKSRFIRVHSVRETG